MPSGESIARPRAWCSARGPCSGGSSRRSTRSAREYRDVCAAVQVLGHLSPRVQDTLVARGEQLSATLLAAAVTRARRRATYVDALDVVRTDDEHGGAAPLLDDTAVQARKVLRPLVAAGTIAVVPGFIGRAPDGSLTTLGRGGTDLTATLLARSLRARHVVLWKDVPGILTADPRLVPDARVIPQLHHREAAEVAHYGAKVLHPRALIPIAGTRITLRVRSFIDPALPGTEVSARQSLKAYPVKALAILPAQAVITVAGKGMVGVHGIAARTFTAVDAAGLSVSTIFQASSESSIGFTVPEDQAERAVAGVRQGLRHELTHGLIDGVTARTRMAVIAVVGEGMVGTPGHFRARVHGARSRRHQRGGDRPGIVGAQYLVRGRGGRRAGSGAPGPRRISIVEDRRRTATVEAAHRRGAARIRPRRTRALGSDCRQRPQGEDVRIVGLLDRSGYVFDARGLSRPRLLRLARAKDAGALLATLGGHKAAAPEALALMAGHAVSRPVVVDVTSDDTGSLLHTAVGQGFDVVMANKKPLSGSWESYSRLLESSVTTGRRIRYEATVGAGLPIIDTYRKLAETGDRVLRIDGCVSGTLMYVLSEVSAGRPFSQAVREAVERGYAEPDPRDDLSGRDAARKGLILARMMGYRGAAPSADDLVPHAVSRIAAEGISRSFT